MCGLSVTDLYLDLLLENAISVTGRIYEVLKSTGYEPSIETL